MDTTATYLAQQSLHEWSTLQQDQTSSLLRIATAEKIQNAAGDAVSLALSTGFRGEVASLTASQANVQDALSYADTAAGTLDGAADLLIRAEELSVRAANDTLGDDERAMIERELASIEGALGDLAGQSGPSGAALFGESFSVYDGGGLATLVTGEIDPEALGVDSLGAGSTEEARANLSAVEGAFAKLLSERGNVSTFAGRMSAKAHHLDNVQLATSAALSRISDADFAMEATRQASLSIRSEATAAALAQNLHGMSALASLFRS